MRKILFIITAGLFIQEAYAQQNQHIISVNNSRGSLDASQLTRGKELFLQNCATCHGNNAEGAPNWRQKGPNGKYPAPPLNGTGHAWHHSMEVLRMTIREGTQRLGGSMPPWGDKLTKQDIDAIIAWFQNQWPDEIYQEWKRRNNN